MSWIGLRRIGLALIRLPLIVRLCRIRLRRLRLSLKRLPWKWLLRWLPCLPGIWLGLLIGLRRRWRLIWLRRRWGGEGLGSRRSRLVWLA